MGHKGQYWHHRCSSSHNSLRDIQIHPSTQPSNHSSTPRFCSAAQLQFPIAFQPARTIYIGMYMLLFQQCIKHSLNSIISLNSVDSVSCVQTGSFLVKHDINLASEADIQMAKNDNFGAYLAVLGQKS